MTLLANRIEIPVVIMEVAMHHFSLKFTRNVGYFGEGVIVVYLDYVGSERRANYSIFIAVGGKSPYFVVLGS